MKYQVVYRSTGIVAFSTNVKAFAEEWYNENEYSLETGKRLYLFEIRKAKKK